MTANTTDRKPSTLRSLKAANTSQEKTKIAVSAVSDDPTSKEVLAIALSLMETMDAVLASAAHLDRKTDGASYEANKALQLIAENRPKLKNRVQTLQEGVSNKTLLDGIRKEINRMNDEFGPLYGQLRKELDEIRDVQSVQGGQIAGLKTDVNNVRTTARNTKADLAFIEVRVSRLEALRENVPVWGLIVAAILGGVASWIFVANGFANERKLADNTVIWNNGPLVTVFVGLAFFCLFSALFYVIWRVKKASSEERKTTSNTAQQSEDVPTVPQAPQPVQDATIPVFGTPSQQGPNGTTVIPVHTSK